MSCRIETGETVIGIDEAGDESDDVITPSGKVFEVCEDEFAGLLGLCFGKDCYRDDKHGCQGCPE